MKPLNLAIQGSVEPNRSIYSNRGDPMTYPCEALPEPMLILDRRMIPIDWQWPDEAPRCRHDGVVIDRLLRQNGAAGLQQRVAQIAFGANRDPANVLWKLDHYGGAGISRDIVAVPGYIHDCDVVACNLGYWGYIYASLLLHRPPLLHRPYLAGTKAPVTVVFLDHEQMQCLHESEGVVKQEEEERPYLNCDVAHFEVSLINGVSITAQLYALSLPFLSFDRTSPVPFVNVDTRHRPENSRPMSQPQLFERLADEIGVDIPEGFESARGQWLANVLRNDKLQKTQQRMELYTYVRKEIIDRFCLHDEDGVVRSGNEGLSKLMPVPRAWSPAPTLQQQL